MTNRTDVPMLTRALSLLNIPSIFSQDSLLTAQEFIQQAKERGHELTLDLLESWHNLRILVPLYRVSDMPVSGRQIDVAQYLGVNVHGWTFQAAVEGRLRDAAEEGYSAAWPYTRPKDVDPRQWWNGFVYSSWQLRCVRDAIGMYSFAKVGLFPHLRNHKRQVSSYRNTLALAALSTKYLPGVLGRISIPPGQNANDLILEGHRQETFNLIKIIGVDPLELKKEAELMLSVAHNDPLAKWIPLTRHAKYEGWVKLRGEPLDAMWKRVAAEVLLRAYEDLAAENLTDPLPDLTHATAWSPRHDRLTAEHPQVQTLERALAELGLSPHPKVILIVEGKTERDHISQLLTVFGLAQPQDVRIQDAKSSKMNPHLIARYGITPRVGRRLNDRWILDASPTALFIVMDPENGLEKKEKRETLRRRLQNAVREEVRYQDADISQEELDHLIHVHTWGNDKYELANFTDDELVPAITRLASCQANSLVNEVEWEKILRAELQAARLTHDDIKVPMGRMRVREDKVTLARFLWPTIRAKLELEYSADTIETPVLKIVQEVRELHSRMTGVFALVGREADNASGIAEMRSDSSTDI